MNPYTVWTEGATRAARYRREAEAHRAVVAAGLASPTRTALARLVRAAAVALARAADRIAAAPNARQDQAPHPAARRTPAANA